MKIVVNGASGHVGKNIVPKLVEAEVVVVVVGRDDVKLRRLFPDCTASTYDDWLEVGKDADLVVHLAVANTTSDLSPTEIRAVNVDGLLKVAHDAKRAGIPRFLNVSSVHALDDENLSDYASSKREAALQLREVAGIKTSTVYLAAVSGSTFSGKLDLLNHVPTFLRQALFSFVSAFKPVVQGDKLVEHILLTAQDEANPDAILVDNKDASWVYTGIRRFLDIAFALFVLVFLNWVLVLIWLAIKCENSGPSLFRQERVGQYGKPFIVYKFRSMHMGTQQVATHQVSSSAITRVGAFLRRSKLDELPQVWNILRNEMSLIGPRPCLPSQHALVAERLRLGVLNMKPGITGLAQINNIDMSNPKLLAQWDARYMSLRGLLLDMRILLATAFGRGQGDRAKGVSP